MMCLALLAVAALLPVRSSAARSAARSAPPDDAVTPFRIAVPDAVLADLRERLARTRFPDEIEGSGWTYGTNLAYLRELVEYWRTDYDWREHEGRLNRFPQFTTTIDDLEIHFIHQRSSHADALPLLLLHGWPSSFYEFTKVIGPLSEPTRFGGEPTDAFHVVVMSLPGYGFSGKPTRAGYGTRRTARIAAARRRTAEGSREGGYGEIQRTRPQTLAYGLNDSPAGQAAWILEKWRTWSDSGGDPEARFTKDELLTNIMIYWVTETGNSSARMYYEARAEPVHYTEGRVEVPVACALFAREIVRWPRRWVEAQYNLVRWTEIPRGGHFAAFEEPLLLAEDVRAFFRDLLDR